MQVSFLSKEEWARFSETAHKVVFSEARPSSMDRIDFCIMTGDESLPYSFATVRELDSESVYLQYGGAFPSAEKSIKAFSAYLVTLHALEEKGYKRVSTLVENENIPMLKFAFKAGLRVIGVRVFEGKIYCELFKEFRR